MFGTLSSHCRYDVFIYEKIEFPLFLSFHFVWIMSLYDKQILEIVVMLFRGLNKNNFYMNCNKYFI
jgi:hypothetical protein